MKNELLVSAARLNELIENGRCKVVDCRFDFSNTDRGRADWMAGHVPGAAYAHLDDDLSSPVEDHTGRHPLPLASVFASYLSSIGWSSSMILVAYDAGSNAIASRLWWLMRFFGQRAALLDGGLPAWVEAGLPLETGVTTHRPAPVEKLQPNRDMVSQTEQIHRLLGSTEQTILDARAAERFSGETEYLDTRAGHIPGSLNRPFEANLGADGRFRGADELREEFESILGRVNPSQVIHSCGSGVTACHNQFAMELAGLGSSRVYAGSWSEWIRDPSRPIETGNPG